MPIRDLKTFGSDLIEEYNKGKAANLAILDKYFATDITYHTGGGQEIHGLNNYKKNMSEFFDAFPDIHFTLDDMIVEADKVVWRITMSGTMKGGMAGFPSTNKKMTVWMISIDRISDGKIAEEWERYDTLGFMQQLGLIPAPKKEK